MKNTNLIKDLLSGQDDNIKDVGDFSAEIGKVIKEGLKDLVILKPVEEGDSEAEIEKKRLAQFEENQAKKKQLEDEANVAKLLKADENNILLKERAERQLEEMGEIKDEELAYDFERFGKLSEKWYEMQGTKSELDEAVTKSGLKSVKLLVDARKQELSNFADNIHTMAQVYPEAEKASKRLAQTQALMDTYASAVAAYKAMVGIPIVGPGLAMAASAAAVGAGMANVKMIEKAQFGMDKIISDPTLIMAGEGSQPESVNITPLNTDTGDAIGGGGSTNIQITGNVMSDDFVEQELADKLIEATRRGNTFA